MNSFRNPKWSLPITIVPVGIFLWIHYGTYQIIQTQLTSEELHGWWLYGTVLSIIWILHSGFSFFLIILGSALERKYGRITLWVYLLFVFLYLNNFYNMIPPSVPGWVASENKRLYALIFIAPTLLHSLIVISSSLYAFPKPFKKRNLLLIAVPSVICAILLTLPAKIRPGPAHTFIILLFLLSSAALLHGIIKAFDFEGLKRFFARGKYIGIVKPLLAISFPLTGMFLNSDILFDAGFGNFSNVSFYLWSILNGLVTCVPDFKLKSYRIIVFLIRSMTYSYIVWLIITFLPRLPLSAITISSFGLGYLMVTPLIIIIFHTRLLINDASYLYYHIPRRTIRLMFVVAASISILANTFEVLVLS
ncbi:MAG TPA: hypothetical protein VFW11_08555 [Cyclobacteriaceae bacterium]|nr:hypothetical protein [Cyclobacteriaceae bacterium]